MYHMRIPLASRSSSGLGHRPFTAATRVRIPYGMPLFVFITSHFEMVLAASTAQIG